MNTRETDVLEIDIMHLLGRIWRKKFLILMVASFFATVGLVLSLFVLKPEYTSTTRIYVVNKNNDAANLTTQDLQIGDYLVKDYQEIIKSKDVLATVIEDQKLRLTTAELSQKITISNQANTRVISIAVEDGDPKAASEIANAIREVAADKIKAITRIEEVTVLEKAEPSSSPSSPNIKRNTLLALLLGVFLAVSGILLAEVLDDTVKRPEDVEEVLKMTLLGVVPDVEKL